MSGTAGLITFYRGENPLHADKLNAAFVERLLRTGDSMTGSLLLSHDPVVPFEAATKQYVDNRIFASGGATGTFSSGIFTGIVTPAIRNGGASRSWVGLSDRGYMTYYDTQSQVSIVPPSAIAMGIAASVRASDRLFAGGGTANIGIGAFATSDSADPNAGSTWSFYGTNRKVANCPTLTIGMELSTGCLGPCSDFNPYQTGAPNSAFGLWLSSGSEAAESGQTVYPASGAIGIVTNGSTWNNGIVMGATALTPDATTGNMRAIMLPTKAEIRWSNDNTFNSRTSFIRCDATAPSVGLVAKNNVMTLVDSQTETPQLTIDTSGNITARGSISAGNNTANAANITLNAAAGFYRSILVQSVGVLHWGLYFANDATSDFLINRYDDSGNYTGQPLSISRATGQVTLESNLWVKGGQIAAPSVSTAVGTAISLVGGITTNAAGAGGTVTLQGGGASNGATSTGGAITIAGGDSAQTGGTVTMRGGNASVAGGPGGNIVITSGKGSTIGNTGQVTVSTQNAAGVGTVGDLILLGGNCVNSVAGAIRLTSGTNGGNTGSGRNGGLIAITTGPGGLTNGNGGDVTVTTGIGTGTGRRGLVIVTGLPTVDPHIVGALWANGAAVNISAG